MLISAFMIDIGPSPPRAQGFAVVEGMLTLAIIAILSAGLALFMGRTAKAVRSSAEEALTSCARPTCTTSAAQARCLCGKRTWSLIP